MKKILTAILLIIVAAVLFRVLTKVSPLPNDPDFPVVVPEDVVPFYPCSGEKCA